MLAISTKPKEYWDSLQSKEDLYETFETMTQLELAACSGDPDNNIYYSDEEFKEVAGKMKKHCEALKPLLVDIMAHFTDAEEARRNEAETLFDEFNLDDPEAMVVMAWLLFIALDSDNDKSFIKRVETGNGIPETMASYRAHKRYLEFKKADDERMAEFMKTPEYRMQAAEIKLGLRDDFDY